MFNHSCKEITITIKYFKISIFIILVILALCSISLKNTWIYGSKLNDNVFLSLKPHLNTLLDDKPILIVFSKKDQSNKDSFHKARARDKYEIYRNKHFVLREPIYLEVWESEYLKNKSGIDKKYNIQYLYSEYPIPKAYYLYDFNTDSLYDVKP